LFHRDETKFLSRRNKTFFVKGGFASMAVFVRAHRHYATGATTCCRKCGTALKPMLGKIAAGAALTCDKPKS